MKLDKLVKIHNYLYDNNYSCSLSYHFNKYCLTIDKYNSYSPIGMILNFDHLKNISEDFMVPDNKKILANMKFSSLIIDIVHNNKKLLSYILMLIIIHSIINNDRYEK